MISDCVNLGKIMGLLIYKMEIKLLTSQNYSILKSPNIEDTHEW